MKIVDTDLVLFLLIEIEATKAQLAFGSNLYDSLPYPSELSGSIESQKKILEYKEKLLIQRGNYIVAILNLENELKEVLP